MIVGFGGISSGGTTFAARARAVDRALAEIFSRFFVLFESGGGECPSGPPFSSCSGDSERALEADVIERMSTDGDRSCLEESELIERESSEGGAQGRMNRKV